MKEVKSFIRLATDKNYNAETHNFTNVEGVTLNVKNISEIVEYMPDDPDYNSAMFGSKIIMTNGNEYVIMGWTIDEVLGLIERKS